MSESWSGPGSCQVVPSVSTGGPTPAPAPAPSPNAQRVSRPSLRPCRSANYGPFPATVVSSIGLRFTVPTPSIWTSPDKQERSKGSHELCTRWPQKYHQLASHRQIEAKFRELEFSAAESCRIWQLKIVASHHDARPASTSLGPAALYLSSSILAMSAHPSSPYGSLASKTRGPRLLIM